MKSYERMQIRIEWTGESDLLTGSGGLMGISYNAEQELNIPFDELF